MIHYVPVKVTIDASGLAEVIIDVIVHHHGVLESIVTDRGSLFTSKFWSSLCYFLGIKRKLSTAFYPQTDGQTERQNSTMEAYFRAFVNWEQDDWARLLPIAEFAYNNAKNASTGHTPFKLNCDYHPRISFKEDVDPRLRSRSANELAEELRELIEVCCQNLLHAQELHKRAHDKGVKSRSYAPGKKVWLNSKYIKMKRNKKLENKFFGPFRVLHAVGKQAYKLELPMKWKIHDVFYVLLLEQDTTRKGRVDKALPEPEKKFEFEVGDNKEYEIEAIIDSAVYGQQANDQIPGLYYLVSWKGYLEEKNTWESSSAVIHLRKLINTFHKEHPEKPTATSPLLDSAPPMVRPTIPKSQNESVVVQAKESTNEAETRVSKTSERCPSWPQMWMSYSSL